MQRDLFVFTGGRDIVTDFEPTIDRIDLTAMPGLNSFAGVLAAASQVGNAVVFRFGTDTLTLQNTRLSEIDNGDFFF